MSAVITIRGRLGADPVTRQTSNGNQMATGSLAVTLPSRQDDETEWFNLIAFGRVAETLVGQLYAMVITYLSTCGRWCRQSHIHMNKLKLNMCKGKAGRGFSEKQIDTLRGSRLSQSLIPIGFG